MLKKILVFFAILTLLTGCSSKPQQKEITFSSWGSVTETKILKQIIMDFEKENPDIKVNLLHTPQNYFQKIHLLFASNTAPDVIFINNLYLPVYENKLEDLSDKIDIKNFYPQAIDGMSINGKLLAVPRDISNLIFYINLDLMNMPEEDWSINQFQHKVLEVKKSNHFGVSFENDIFWAFPYLTYFGGGILDKNGDLIIDTEKSQTGLEFYKNLKNKYHVAPTKSEVGSSTTAQMFLDRKIALYLSGRWMYPKISEKADFNWAVINFPYGEKPLPLDVSGWALSKNSKHKEAGIRFISFLSSSKSIEYLTDTGLIVPARIEVAKKLNNVTHNEKCFLEVINHSEKTPVSRDYKKIIDKINRELGDF